MATPIMRITRVAALALAVAFAAACGDDDDITGLDPSQYELVVVSGSGQTGIAGTLLSQPLVVSVRRIDTGAGEEGVPVRWRVMQGDGAPTRIAGVTGEEGRATTRIVLGQSAGDLQVRASVEGLDPVIIASLTALPAPTIQSLSPGPVDPGDVIDVVVNDLAAGMPIQVLFDGVAGTITDRQDGSPATLRVVVPAPAGVCAGSRDVDVRLRVDRYTGPASALTVNVAADPFQVGQVLVMESGDEVQCALLPADGGTAQYLLVALSSEFETSATFEVTLGGSSVAFAPVEGAPAPAEGFNARLRAFERLLAARGLAARTRPSAAAQLFAQPEVGSTRRFWVINDVEALPDVTESDFDRVTATLKFVGVHTLVYLDDAAPEPGLSQTEIEELAELYDRVLYETDVDYYGDPTDRDNNDRVILLLSPTVNSLTPRGAEGIIVGFFFGVDLFNPGTQDCPACQFSNDGELFYGIVPDPDGEFSDPRTRERVLEVLPGVMIHETEHMVNFRFKVFVHNLPSIEELWLSEGLAHMAEELGGDEADAVGLTDEANDLYGSNFGRAFSFLGEPQSSSLTVVEGNGTLGERGAAWLFLRWLADQYGDFIFRDIVSARENGIANIEAQTGEDFFRLFADWAVALWADDLSISGLAERYQFPKWQMRSILLEEVQGGDPVYVLQPDQSTFTELRAQGITELMAASSPFYVELDAGGDTNDLQLELSALAGAGLAVLRYE